MKSLGMRPLLPKGMAHIVRLIFVLLPMARCAPIEDGIPWDEKPQELAEIHSEENTQNSNHPLYKFPEISSDEELAILRELSKIIKQDKTMTKAPEGLIINLDQKSRVITPYYMKSVLPNPPKRGVSTPYFMKRGVSAPYFMKKAGVSSPYFMKRVDGRVFTPYFLKRGVNTPYFLKREGAELQDEAGMYQHPIHDLGSELDEKRFFGHMNSLDVENLLASHGAYSRQIMSNEQRLNEAGR